MSDLLRTQIHESCKLALPNGLHELTSDIAREVLRAQPGDLYRFITDYLSSMLVTREHLTIASRVCNDLCQGICHEELEDELRQIGLSEEDAATVKSVVEKHFMEGKANEANLMRVLIAKTEMDESHLPNIQDAVRKAFLRYQANHTAIRESSSEEDMDETKKAVKHTLRIYKNTKPNEAQQHDMATKIQAAYRGYGVKRKVGVKAKTNTRKPEKKSLRFDYQDICTKLTKHHQKVTKIESTKQLFPYPGSPDIEPQSSISSSKTQTSTEPSNKSWEEFYFQGKLMKELRETESHSIAETEHSQKEFIGEKGKSLKSQDYAESGMVETNEIEDKTSTKYDNEVIPEVFDEDSDKQIESQFYDTIEEDIVKDAVTENESNEPNADEVADECQDVADSSDDSDFKDIRLDSKDININEFLGQTIYKGAKENDIDEEHERTSGNESPSDEWLNFKEIVDDFEVGDPDKDVSFNESPTENEYKEGNENSFNEESTVDKTENNFDKYKQEEDQSKDDNEKQEEKRNAVYQASHSRLHSVPSRYDDDEDMDPIDMFIQNEYPFSDFV